MSAFHFPTHTPVCVIFEKCVKCLTVLPVVRFCYCCLLIFFNSIHKKRQCLIAHSDTFPLQTGDREKQWKTKCCLTQQIWSEFFFLRLIYLQICTHIVVLSIKFWYISSKIGEFIDTYLKWNEKERDRFSMRKMHIEQIEFYNEVYK